MLFVGLFGEENKTATLSNTTTQSNQTTTGTSIQSPTIVSTGSFKIFDTDEKFAYIHDGTIKKGTSGIIVHHYKNGDKVIVASAVVISVKGGKSKLKLDKFEILENSSVATTRKIASNGDIFVAKHLYNNAIIIAPNMQTHKLIKESFFGVHFLTSDIFASILKIDNNPTPTQKDIQKFCKDNLISTIYIYAKNFLYVVDANSFKSIEKHNMKKHGSDTIKPFYSLVEGIDKGSFAWFDADDIGNYDDYYNKLLSVSYDN